MSQELFFLKIWEHILKKKQDLMYSKSVWVCELHTSFIFSFMPSNILSFYAVNLHFSVIKNITWNKKYFDDNDQLHSLL